MDNIGSLENHIVRMCIISLGTLSIVVPLLWLTMQQIISRKLLNRDETVSSSKRWRSSASEEQHILDDMGHPIDRSGEQSRSLLDLQDLRFSRAQQRLQRWILMLCLLFLLMQTCLYALIPELPKLMPNSGRDDDDEETGSRYQWWRWNGDIVLAFWLPVFLPKLLNIIVMSLLYTSIGAWFAKTYFHTKQRQLLERHVRVEGKSSMMMPSASDRTALRSSSSSSLMLSIDDTMQLDGGGGGGDDEDDLSYSVSSTISQTMHSDAVRRSLRMRCIVLFKNCTTFAYVVFNLLLALVLVVTSFLLHHLLYTSEGMRLLFVGISVAMVTFFVLVITTTFTIIVTHLTRSIEFSHYTSIIVRRVRRVWFLFVIIFVTYTVLFSAWLARLPIISCMRLRFPFQTPISNENCMQFDYGEEGFILDLRILGTTDDNLTAETLLWFLCYQLIPMWLIFHCFRPIAPQNLNKLHLIKVSDFDYNRSIEWRVSDEFPQVTIPTSGPLITPFMYQQQSSETDYALRNSARRPPLRRSNSNRGGVLALSITLPSTTPTSPIGRIVRTNTFNRQMLSIAEDMPPAGALGSPSDHLERRKRKRRANRRLSATTPIPLFQGDKGSHSSEVENQEDSTMYDISII